MLLLFSAFVLVFWFLWLLWVAHVGLEDEGKVRRNFVMLISLYHQHPWSSPSSFPFLFGNPSGSLHFLLRPIGHLLEFWASALRLQGRPEGSLGSIRCKISESLGIPCIPFWGIFKGYWTSATVTGQVWELLSVTFPGGSADFSLSAIFLRSSSQANRDRDHKDCRQGI